MSKQVLILSAGLLGLLGMGLSACGQKGPLYLPQTTAPAATGAAPAPPSSAASAPSR